MSDKMIVLWIIYLDACCINNINDIEKQNKTKETRW